MSVACLIKHHVTRTYDGVQVQLHALLTSADYGGEWTASCLGRTARLIRITLN